VQRGGQPDVGLGEPGAHQAQAGVLGQRADPARQRQPAAALHLGDDDVDGVQPDQGGQVAGDRTLSSSATGTGEASRSRRSPTMSLAGSGCSNAATVAGVPA
jgi:hypothetical protein